MATYSYVAKDVLGKIVTETVEAENERVLVRQLQERGFWVQKVTAVGRSKAVAPAQQQAVAHSRGKASTGFWIFGAVKRRDLSIFCRQFATMIDAGVSMVRCLTVLEEQSASATLKRIIRDIQGRVEGGDTLSRALGEYPRVFDNLFVGLVRAGEVGGVLDETLNRLSGFLEDDVRLRRKVKSSMVYPVLVMMFALTVVTFLVTFIVPQIAKFLRDQQVPLPWLTQQVIWTSDFLIYRWWMLVSLIVLFSLAFTQYIRTRTGAWQWDWLKLKIPVIGKLNHKIALARFSRTLGTLLVSGVPILQALETVAEAIGNRVMSDAILNARNHIREGERVGDPLEKSRLFPPMVVQMIAIGEETGSLDMMLTKISEFYESEVEAAVQALTSALEPVMIIFVGLMVGTIVIAMFLPMVALVSELSNRM